jgi:uncharacterized protein with HEPN domain
MHCHWNREFLHSHVVIEVPLAVQKLLNSGHLVISDFLLRVQFGFKNHILVFALAHNRHRPLKKRIDVNAITVARPVRLRAFERVMELVGESAKRLPDVLRAKYPEIPWRKVAGMRDVISHPYEDLMYEILWDALHINFPSLLSTVNSILEDLGPTE